MLYTIGEVAKMLRISTHTLRVWERQGLIAKPNRRLTGYREYTEADIEAIQRFLSQKHQTK